MKTCISLIISLLFITCSKENINEKVQSDLKNNETTSSDTGMVPLNDLGKKTFMGYTGGLYPHGQNVPPGTYADNLLNKCQNIIPLDTFGNDASHHGKILFISMGGSTGGHNMKLLIQKTHGNPLTNPFLKLLSCNNGTGTGSLKNIMDPGDNVYWEHVKQVINGSGSSYRQVQIVYMETEDSSTYINFPGRPDSVRDEIETAMRTLKKKFPNVKLLYVLGRTRTFGTKAIWNKEPAPYYFGWACKWAIEDQINGVKGTDYKGKDAVAPMITWGFYQWADSLPRKTDDFYWRSYETTDGLHATPDGQDTLATRFQNFLLTDKYASIWYAAH